LVIGIIGKVVGVWVTIVIEVALGDLADYSS
jgi:hypothetical protein